MPENQNIYSIKLVSFRLGIYAMVLVPTVPKYIPWSQFLIHRLLVLYYTHTAIYDNPPGRRRCHIRNRGIVLDISGLHGLWEWMCYRGTFSMVPWPSQFHAVYHGWTFKHWLTPTAHGCNWTRIGGTVWGVLKKVLWYTPIQNTLTRDMFV